MLPLTGGDRIVGWVDPVDIQRIQRLLHLPRERGGRSGTEFGWRYLRWDPPNNSQLVQLLDDPTNGPRVVLLYDDQPPSDDTIEGLRVQTWIAATAVGMTTTEPTTTHDWADLAQRAAATPTFDEAVTAIGRDPTTAHDDQLTRAFVLAISQEPAWQAAIPALRRDVEQYLLGILERTA